MPVSFALTDENGDAVPATLSFAHGVRVVRPDTLLHPNTGYTLTLTTTDGDTASTSFTTGAAEDHSRPVLSGVPTVEHRADLLSSCGPSEVFQLTWPTQADDVTPASQIVIEGMLAARQDIRDTAADVASMDKLTVASGYCTGRTNIVNMDVAFVRARAVDWAGNTSELTETVQLKPDAGTDTGDRGGCGCNAGEGALVLAWLGLLLRRRAAPLPSVGARPR